ncbi:MAG: hypothetical protein JOZ51_09445 [Chloroflexi bacterium]|nr:hypothetical protein [Chloroflexota bacterium]
MSNLSEALSAGSEPAHQTPSAPQRPLGVTLIVGYFVLSTLVYLVAFLALPFGLASSELLGESPSIIVASISVPLTLFVAWGLWHCYSWARTVIICVGMPMIALSLLGGTEDFRTWVMLAIVLYLFQRRIGDVFSPAPAPQP